MPGQTIRLITGVAASLSPLESTEQLNVAVPNLDARVSGVKVSFPGRPAKTVRTLHFAILPANGEVSEENCERLAEALGGLVSLMLAPFLDRKPELLSVLSSNLQDRPGAPPELVLRTSDASVAQQVEHCLMFSVRDFASVLPALPCLAASPYFEAVHYYQASVYDYCFLGGDIDIVLREPEATPTFQVDIVRAERAVHSAFKAVEALIGEPPKDVRKLKLKIRELGIDPDTVAGWTQPKESLVAKVQMLQKLRDKRAAHASPHRKAPLTYYDVMDAQGCAQGLILLGVQAELGKDTVKHT
jgi:hypothetical protein